MPLMHPPTPASSGLERLLRAGVVLVCLLALGYFVVSTWRWPLIWDATVMHYVNFLMAHGVAPYRDIFDINLPAIYLIDGWQMHLFGPGDLAFRMWEFFLLACLTGAMIAIAWPRDWLAGLLAGTIFIVLHASDGPNQAAQRDEIVTVLLTLGYALLFHVLRRASTRPAQAARPPWTLAFMFLAGALMSFAAGIKPPIALLSIALLVLAGAVMKRRGLPWMQYLACAVAGAAVSIGVQLQLLHQHHAFNDMLVLATHLTAFYSGLMTVPLSVLLYTALPQKLGLAVALVAVPAAIHRRWTGDWERWALLIGVFGGLLSYLLQHKGYVYQRYPVVAFAALWTCLQIADLLRERRWLRWAGAVAATYCVLGLIPLSLLILHRLPPPEIALMHSLEADLTHLGGDRLQHQVQCLDMVDGCLGALYHLGLVQNTGFTGDTLFFLTESSPSATYYRNIFWQDLQRSPPQVFVVTDEWFNWERGFEKLDHWPEFAAYLAANYTVVETRQFERAAYRIYVRKINRLSR